MKIISRDLICTKYVGPTNHRGARVSVTQGNTRSVYTWDDALDVTENHASAARAYVEKMRADLGPFDLVPLLVPDASPYAYAFLVVDIPPSRSPVKLGRKRARTSK